MNSIPTSAWCTQTQKCMVKLLKFHFSIYATSVLLALSYNQCLVSILFADVLVNTAILTSNIIFVNVFYLLVSLVLQSLQEAYQLLVLVWVHVALVCIIVVIIVVVCIVILCCYLKKKSNCRSWRYFNNALIYY